MGQDRAKAIAAARKSMPMPGGDLVGKVVGIRDHRRRGARVPQPTICRTGLGAEDGRAAPFFPNRIEEDLGSACGGGVRDCATYIRAR